MNNKTLALNSLNSALGNTRGIGEIGRAGTSRVKKENRVQENTKGKGESSGEREHKEKKGTIGRARTPRGKGKSRACGNSKGKGEISGVRELQGDRGRGGNRVARKHEGKRRN